MFRKHLRLISTYLALLVLTACSSARDTGSNQSAATPPSAALTQVTVALNADTRTLEPLTPLDATTTRILRNLYDPLFFRDENMKLIPWLAKSAVMNQDSSWTIELNQGIRFTNGEEFNAETVVANLQFILDPKNKALTRSMVADITKVEAAGPYTVKITTAKPLPELTASLTDIFFVPAKLQDEKGIQSLAAAPVGTGPYMLESWQKDQELVLKANPNYFKGKPAIDKVVFRVIPEVQSRLAALMAGEIDLFPDVPPEAVDQLKAKNMPVKSVPGRLSIYIAMNIVLAPSPLQNVKVRQALNYAVDVDAIIKNTLMGYATHTPGGLIPINAAYNSNIKPYPYDPEKAKKLLAEAGYPNGFTITLNAPKGRYLKDFEAAQAIAKQLEKVGITVKLQTYEWATYLDMMAKRKMPELFMNGRSDREMAGSFLPQLFKTNAPYNAFSDQDLDKALDAGISILDPQARQQAYNQLQEQVWNLAPWIFLWEQHDLYGANPKLVWNPRGDQQLVIYNATVKE